MILMNSVERPGPDCCTITRSHFAEVDALVANPIEQGRIVENKRGIVVRQCDIVATQCCHMGTDRKAQEAIDLLALLCLHCGDAPHYYRDKKCSNHPNFVKYRAKIAIILNLFVPLQHQNGIIRFLLRRNGTKEGSKGRY